MLLCFTSWSLRPVQTQIKVYFVTSESHLNHHKKSRHLFCDQFYPIDLIAKNVGYFQKSKPSEKE